MQLKKKLFVLVLAAVAMVHGCSNQRTYDLSAEGEKLYVDELSQSQKNNIRNDIKSALTAGIKEYLISPEDTLEVMYHTASIVEADDYRLRVADEVRVEFAQHPDMNRNLVVRSDGKITIPRKGDIMAAGKETEALAAEIKDLFAGTFRNPMVTVNVLKSTNKIMELKEAIQNLPRGQAKLVKVTPDGYINLPLIDRLVARDKTVQSVKKDIDTSYKKLFNNLNITVALESVAGKQVFVFGEVKRPGSFKFVRPVTVLQLISQAGGVTESGSLENIKVLFWNKQKTPQLRTVNMLNVMEDLKLEEEVLLADNSVVYVPKTGIAKVNKVIDQYIRKVFLYNGTSMGFVYEFSK